MLSLKKLTLTGAMILVMLAAPLAVVQADIPGLVSDDFHDGFNTSLWQPDTLEEYDHESTFFSQQTAGGDSYLQIAVPGGAKRSLSFDAGSLQAPRVLQEVQDDGTKVFTFTARFLSIPSFPSDPETGDPVGTAIQGIVIKGVYDPSDIPGVQSFPSYWRLGVQSTTIANQVKPYGSWFYKSNQGWGPGFTVFEPPYQPDDEEDYRINAPQNTPLWLKVDRTVEQIDGNVCSTFTFSYSLDGDDWIESPPKDQDIPPENSCGGPPYFLNRIRDTFKITHIGIFAGTTGDNPAYTAKIDWVSITDTAPDNEDEDPPVSTYTLTTEVSPSGAGTISVNPNKAQYEEDESVTLTATANSGYLFEKWVVDGVDSGTNPTLNLEMDENKEVEAVFAIEPPPNEFTESVFLPMVMR